MESAASKIERLRSITQVPILECKKALDACSGAFDSALVYLRECGAKVPANTSESAAGEGSIFSYIHGNGKLGVLVEVRCTTDFAAHTDEFQDFGHKLAMHIAASSPVHVTKKDVPPPAVAAERSFQLGQLSDSKKTESIKEKIVDGRMRKYFSEICLVEQEWIHDKILVSMAIADISNVLKESVTVTKFTRYAIGSV